MEIDNKTSLSFVERGLLERFQRLEDEMREHYKWCKIKLHIWGAILLVLLMVLR